MSDLREQVLAIVSKACVNSDDPCDVCGQRADAVMAVVQPEIEAKDARIAELEARVDRFKKQRAGWSGISDLRAEANEYEAERDRLRARLTGVAIHAHRLANRIQPDTPAWAVLADLRAAIDQPGDEPTHEADPQAVDPQWLDRLHTVQSREPDDQPKEPT